MRQFLAVLLFTASLPARLSRRLPFRADVNVVPVAAVLIYHCLQCCSLFNQHDTCHTSGYCIDTLTKQRGYRTSLPAWHSTCRSVIQTCMLQIRTWC